MTRPGAGRLAAAVARLGSAAKAAVERFPLAVASGAVAGVSLAWAVSDPDAPDFWWELWFPASLGLPLFTAVALCCERLSAGRTARWLLNVPALGLLVALFFLFRAWEEPNRAQRYGHLLVTLHLWAAVAPYLALRSREPRGFWQFNRRMFFRFAAASIYAVAIAGGIALAMLALDELFGVEIAERRYAQLVFLTGYCFHPVFFLAGVPRDFGALDRDTDYPVAIKVFSQYVMLPLVAVYVAILTAYMGKILLTWDWPSGRVSIFVSILAAVGIFSLLMVHPERLKERPGWVERYALAFWIAILPSAVMVVLAVWHRVAQYGITERRYLLGMLALWLIAAALYAAIARTRGIRFIPLSLAVCGTAAFFGPWSAYAVSERSQLARLGGILAEQGALGDDGRASLDTVEIDFEAWSEARAAVSYMRRHHGPASLEPILAEGAAELGLAPEGEDAEQGAAAGGFAAMEDEIAVLMAGLRVSPGPSSRPGELRLAPGAPIPSDGYELLSAGRPDGEIEVDGRPLRLRLSADGAEMVMELGAAEAARAALSPVLEAAARRREPRTAAASATGRPDEIDMPAEEMVVDLAGGGLAARVVLGRLDFEGAGAAARATSFSIHAVLLRRSEDGGGAVP